jgi:hypothetical protein
MDRREHRNQLWTVKLTAAFAAASARQSLVSKLNAAATLELPSDKSMDIHIFDCRR